MTSSASISTQSAAGKPFDPDAPSKSLLDLVGKLNGHRRDLPGRAPGRDHHMVGDVGLAGQRDGNDLLRLVVVERLEHELVKVFDVGWAPAALAASAGCSVKGSPGEQGHSRCARARAQLQGIGDTSWGLARE